MFASNQFTNMNSDSHQNETQEPFRGNDRVQVMVYVLRIIFIISFSIVTIFGNILCIRVLRHTPDLHGGTKVLMMSLAVSDLSVGFIGSLSIVPAILGVWPYGNVICKMSCTTSICFCVCSVMSLCLLAVDRCLAVTRPFQHATLISKNRALIVIIVIWLLAMIIVIVLSIDVDVSYNKTAALCVAMLEHEQYLVQTVLLVLFLYFIPIIVMVVTYSKLLLISRRHAKQICALDSVQSISSRCSIDASVTLPDEQTQNVSHSIDLKSLPTSSAKSASVTGKSSVSDRPSTRGRASLSSITNRCKRSMKEWKALKMFCTVTVVFTITWMPYVCTTLANTIKLEHLPGWAEFLVQWLALCNSWCNVCIYLLMNMSFRTTAVRLVKSGQATACLCCYKCCLRSRDES